jgi:hypothetical protein
VRTRKARGGRGRWPLPKSSRDRWGLGLGLVESPSAERLIYVVGEPGARLAGLGRNDWAVVGFLVSGAPVGEK